MGIFDQSGYVQPDGEKPSTIKKVSGLLGGLGAAPDPRLVAANSQPKAEPKVVSIVRSANDIAYVQESQGPGVMARVASNLQRLSASPVVQEPGGNLSIVDVVQALSAAPGKSEEDQISDLVHQAKVGARAKLGQEAVVNGAVRKSELVQAVFAGRHKAHLEAAQGVGEKWGESDVRRAQEAAEKAAAAANAVGKVAGNLAGKVSDRAADVRYVVGRVARATLNNIRGNRGSGPVVDGTATDVK